MKYYPPTLQEAIELIAKMTADLKKIPWDQREPERADHVQDAEAILWRYNNLKYEGVTKP